MDAAAVGAGPVVVEDGQRVGIGRQVVAQLAEEECPIVEDVVALPIVVDAVALRTAEADRRNRDAVAGLTVVGEDCHLQRQ